jgi:hypothetical protein
MVTISTTFTKLNLKQKWYQYNMDEEQEMRARWDRDSLAIIEEISKPCPGCHTKTERDGMYYYR